MKNTAEQTILIIEPHSPLQQLYELELQEEGYKTVLASSEAEAHQVLERRAVDVIMCGLQQLSPTALISLLSRAKQHKTTLLINTAYPLPLTDFPVSDGIECIQKTVDTRVLKDKIRELLYKTQQQRPAGGDSAAAF
jgi:DNA-binding response OmpR family regulator